MNKYIGKGFLYVFESIVFSIYRVNDSFVATGIFPKGMFNPIDSASANFEDVANGSEIVAF